MRRAASTISAVLKGKSKALSKRKLLDLSLEELTTCTLLRRPSKRNRSPYVADAQLSDGREVLVHVPSLDMGGKCVPGATLLVKPARDRKGKKIGPNAVNPKYGTPKCEFIAQLLRVEEPENAPGCWIGAHPRLGELIAGKLLETSSVPGLRATTELAKEVRNPLGCDMRADFLVTHSPAQKTLVEVKTIVDTDYAAKTAPSKKSVKCVFIGPEPYRRAGIFPWGKGNQTGPNGEKVVSARAIKHVNELTLVAKGVRKPKEDSLQVGAAVLFIVVRGDALTARANRLACPTFANSLEAAKRAGVKVLAHRVRWGEQDELGIAFDDGEIPVTF